MAWIELHQTLAAHPKTKRLARRLGVPVPFAMGYLACLWCWCLEYAQDGNLSRFDAEELGEAAMFVGDAHTFTAALLEVGFTEQGENGLQLHDWHDYAGRLVERRAANAERMRAARSKHVQNTCNARAGATVPNRTVPNQEIMSTDVDVPSPDVPAEVGPSPLLTPAEDDLDLEAVFPDAAAEGVGSEVSRAAPKPTDMADPDFDAWWALYPRKVAKDEARKAWRRITKKDAPEALTAGLRRWLASADWAGTERQYLPHPATWLNGGRWKDEPEPAGVVPIATAASSPRDAFLTWVRGLTSTIGRNDDKVRCLVERATVVDGVTVDLDAAHKVLEEQGLDEAWVWVHRATQMGKAQRREVANG